MPKFAAGVVKFQKDVFPARQDLFKGLAQGQSPEALFITCSDSRIDPSMLTQTDPGELFIIRNAGNIVPPHERHAGGVTASIEFAVAALNVQHIIVCGHSNCGAMKGALNVGALSDMPHVADWLTYAQSAARVGARKAAGKSEIEVLREVTKENVLMQLQHLRTHPHVAERLVEGRVQLHGWVYDIETGDVLAYDEDAKEFRSVDRRYADELRKVLDKSHDGCAA